ncbi:MAG: FtsX-like permease family protein, partial [Deltaproteobacteria bacterium]|nr:FtsX-like permease family protein [Deltaproteobacteria bacterium]
MDDSLLLQFDAQVGDPIKIGAQTYEVVGRLKRIPGEAVAIGMIHPRVYIPMATLAKTKLIKKGSIVRYRAMFKIEEGRDVEQVVASLKPHFEKHRLRVDTVKERKERLGGIMGNLTRFLNLVGFIALLLGGVGVASGIHIYTRQKVPTVAILRCVGAKANQALFLYIVQALFMGLPGAVLGAGIGLGIQSLLPAVLGDFLPVSIETTLYWPAVILGIGMGLGSALLFALLPLVSLRHTSPLLTLRSSLRDVPFTSKDPLRNALFGIVALGTIGFALLQTDSWLHGLGFAGALGLAFCILAAMAKLLIASVRRFLPESWGYVWRQGLANLHRPNNQTLVLMLSLGLGTFLIMTLHQSQGMLLQKIAVASGEDRPNMVLFEIQADQRANVEELLKTFKLRVIQETPVVTMRLLSVKGRGVNDIRNDPDSNIPKWAIGRQYRSTYRENLVGTEKLVAGSWQGDYRQGSGPVPISVEKGIAEDLQVNLGDDLKFDIYGVPL